MNLSGTRHLLEIDAPYLAESSTFFGLVHDCPASPLKSAHRSCTVCREMSTYALQLKHQLPIGGLEIIGFGSVVVDCYPGEKIRNNLACCVPELNSIGLVNVKRK